MSAPRPIAFVTGKLAEPGLRDVLAHLPASAEIKPVVIVLPIQVAALMTTDWLSRKLSLPESPRVERVILPGLCRGDVSMLTEKLGIPVELGPTDVQDLPEMFGGKKRLNEGYGAFSLEIIAEINDAARVEVSRILEIAQGYRNDGADVIDLGCDAQTDRPMWSEITTVVRELRDRGFRVSIDSFHPQEVASAAKAGAELVLSVNATNRHAAEDWGCEVVVLPDDVRTLGGLEATIEVLEMKNVRYRIDPVLEPIGYGFAASLGRYLEVRRRYPKAAMMMGVGNLTELTEVDSAGINMLLAGFCEELGIRSVLTTQVINWARSSVRELDVARRLAFFAFTRKRLPKHVDRRLVMLRDPRVRERNEDALNQLATELTDRNIRLFTRAGRIHAMNKDYHLHSDDPFELFGRMGIDDESHAFYLGYEMAKAMTAITLGKRYTQDQALNWGMLTREEISHHDRRPRQKPKRANESGESESST